MTSSSRWILLFKENFDRMDDLIDLLYMCHWKNNTLKKNTHIAACGKAQLCTSIKQTETSVLSTSSGADIRGLNIMII